MVNGAGTEFKRFFLLLQIQFEMQYWLEGTTFYRAYPLWKSQDVSDSQCFPEWIEEGNFGHWIFRKNHQKILWNDNGTNKSKESYDNSDKYTELYDRLL